MNALAPVTAHEAEYCASDPVCLAEHADWLRHRVEAHVYDAFTFHRLARRRLRDGLIGVARDNYRCALRHMRMAKHFRRKLA